MKRNPTLAALAASALVTGPSTSVGWAVSDCAGAAASSRGCALVIYPDHCPEPPPPPRTQTNLQSRLPAEKVKVQLVKKVQRTEVKPAAPTGTCPK